MKLRPIEVKIAFVIAFLYFIGIGESIGQWKESNNGLFGGEFTCIAESGSYLFAGTNGAGLYRSVNNGEDWEQVNIGITESLVVTCILSRESKLFVGIANSGLVVSTDNGNTWAESNEGLGGTYISGLADNEEYIYAAAFFDGMYKSSDEGNSWEFIGNGLTGVVRDVTLQSNKIYAATTEGIFASSIQTINWETQNNGLQETNIEIVYSNDEFIFLNNFYDTYRWNGSQEIWEVVHSSPAKLSEANGVLYAAIENHGIFKSEDNGDNWTALNIDMLEKSFKSIYSNGSNIYVGVARAGLLRSSNSGMDWSWVSNGISNVSLSSFAKIENTILTAGVGSGIFISTDEGELWSPFNENLSTSYIYDLVVYKNDFYAATSKGVYQYLEQYDAWSRIATNSIDPYLVHKLAVDGEYLYGGTNGIGMFKTSDVDRFSWIEINKDLNDLYINDLVISDTKIYIGTQTGIFKSEDSGESWSKISTGLALQLGLSDVNVNRLMVNDDYLYCAIHVNGIGFTNDDGSTWENTDLDFGNLNISALVGIEDVILMGSHQRGVFASTDTGFSWKPANYGFDSDVFFIQEFFSTGDKIFAGTKSNGIWSAQANLIIASLKNENNPLSTSLKNESSQLNIYPNPASCNLNIVLSNESKDCNVVVYDLTGRIIDSSRGIQGHLSLDVSKYDNGLYVIEIKMNGYLQTAKFLKE